jgi:hypothetical protein
MVTGKYDNRPYNIASHFSNSGPRRLLGVSQHLARVITHHNGFSIASVITSKYGGKDRKRGETENSTLTLLK